MSINNPNRIMIAATSSASGKTTITCGILKALINRKIIARAFKCGPDYIDPMFHSNVIGVESTNLDLFLMNENTVKYLLCENSKEADISVIEGVMGYYDGMGIKTTLASSYHLSKVTSTPVILVVNCKGKALSVLAEIKGFIDYREDSNIKGVILNNASKFIYDELKDLIENEFKVQVIGYLEHKEEYSLESRHLGLIPAKEVYDLKEKLNKLAWEIEKTIDIDKIISLSKSTKELNYEPIILEKNKKYENLNIAVAKDKAFCFYYEDSLKILKELGANITYFSPLQDKELPKEVDGLILGGGYPELFAKELFENRDIRMNIKDNIENGLPCIGECGGFMYLHKSMEDINGQAYEMVGVVDGHSFKTDKLRRFGYAELLADEDNMLCLKGEKIKAHEFHYWDSTCPGNAFTAKKPIRNTSWNCIVCKNNIFAGYPHINFYSNIVFAINFLNKCLENKTFNGIDCSKR